MKEKQNTMVAEEYIWIKRSSDADKLKMVHNTTKKTYRKHTEMQPKIKD